MPGNNTVNRISAALRALRRANTPGAALDAARRIREAAVELEAAHVVEARKSGATWTEIGAHYGLTKQGAQQRFRELTRKPARDGSPDSRRRPTRRTS